MAIFKRDIAKKQINTITKDLYGYKKKRILSHLIKQDTSVNIWEIFDADLEPEVVKAYAAALQPGNKSRRKIAIETLAINAETNFRLKILMPHQNIIITPLRDCLSDGELDSKYRIECASILAHLGDQNSIEPIRSLLKDETLEPEHRIKCASILAKLGDQNSIEPIRSLLLDETLGPEQRIRCASILAQLGGSGTIESIRPLLIDETLHPKHRIKCALILAQLGDQGSIEPIRSLLKLDNINIRDAGILLQACHKLGISEGKFLAQNAINTFRRFKDQMGINDTEYTFKIAVPYVVAHLDDEAIDYLGEIISEYTNKLKAMRHYTGSQHAVAAQGLNFIVCALATIPNNKVIELLVSFIKVAAPLSSTEGNRVLLHILSIRTSARFVIEVWQKSNNTQALDLLNNEVGEAQVKALLQKN